MAEDEEDAQPTEPRAARKQPRSESDPLVGKFVLDRYLVEECIGAGTMGTVYRGNDAKLERAVAIKVLHDHLVDDASMLARFRREAKVAGRLQHPNVISILDYGQAPDGRHLMVLEFAKGPTLTEMIAIFPARRRIIQLVGQILRGLDHAHAVGLIHRDLKPDNIVVEIADDGTELPRIVDFGIAILRSPEDASDISRLTASGIMMGTPMYMAPEQAQLETYDHRADLFALGVIVYEMLAGKPPFDGTAMEIAVANISRNPPPIAKRAPTRDVDPLLEAFACKLMARRPEQRFASAAAALEVLELLDSDPAEARLRFGQIDVDKALAMISLPPIGRR